MRDRGKFEGVLEFYLDPGPGFFDGVVEDFIQSVSLRLALVEIRKIGVVTAVFSFAEYCRINKLHIVYLPGISLICGSAPALSAKAAGQMPSLIC